jgi:hypothetical protein
MSIGWAIFMLVASYLISYSMMPGPPDPAPPETQDDINFPQIEEGTAQAVIFGDCWSGDWMVLAIGNYRTTEIRKSGGGKK